MLIEKIRIVEMILWTGLFPHFFSPASIDLLSYGSFKAFSIFSLKNRPLMWSDITRLRVFDVSQVDRR
jgi:hypothetical protein